MILKITSNAYTLNDVSRVSLSQHPDTDSERKILHAHSFHRNTVHSMSQAGWLWNLQMVSVTVKVSRVIFEHEKTSLRLPRTSPKRLDCRASDYDFVAAVPPRNVAALLELSQKFNRQHLRLGNFRWTGGTVNRGIIYAHWPCTLGVCCELRAAPSVVTNLRF